MLTADTITDEQLRELRRERFVSATQMRSAIRYPRTPLGVATRARCAEILNARAKDGAK
jgi:hypothetical protein